MNVSSPRSSARRRASAKPRLECPTIPNTRVTPWATRVSTRTSATVRPTWTRPGAEADPLSGPFVRQSDVHPVAALLDVVGQDRVGEVPRGLTRERVVVVPVPRAPQQAILDRPLPQRATLVRTVVVQGA